MQKSEFMEYVEKMEQARQERGRSAVLRLARDVPLDREDPSQ